MTPEPPAIGPQTDPSQPPTDLAEIPRELRHYTRQPLWVIPLGGLIAVVLPIIQPLRFVRLVEEGGLVFTIAALAVGGCMASAALVARSHIRSEFWSNVVLMFGIAVATCVGAAYFAIFEMR